MPSYIQKAWSVVLDGVSPHTTNVSVADANSSAKKIPTSRKNGFAMGDSRLTRPDEPRLASCSPHADAIIADSWYCSAAPSRRTNSSMNSTPRLIMMPWASMYNERNGSNTNMCSADNVTMLCSIMKNDAWACPMPESTPQSTPNPGIRTGALLIVSCNQISSMPLAAVSGTTKTGAGVGFGYLPQIVIHDTPGAMMLWGNSTHAGHGAERPYMREGTLGFAGMVEQDDRPVTIPLPTFSGEYRLQGEDRLTGSNDIIESTYSS